MKICKLLMEEGSQDILNKIIIKDNVIEWKCLSCGEKTEDKRGTRVLSFNLVISDSAMDSSEGLEKTLSYQRERNCNVCQREVIHQAKRNFLVEHLIIVVSDPYSLRIKPSFHFQRDVHDYELISAVLHSGNNNYGHYIAITKESPNVWSCCNDSLIQTLSENEISNYLRNWVITLMIYKVSKIDKIESLPEDLMCIDTHEKINENSTRTTEEVSNPTTHPSSSHRTDLNPAEENPPHHQPEFPHKPTEVSIPENREAIQYRRPEEHQEAIQYRRPEEHQEPSHYHPNHTAVPTTNQSNQYF